MTNSPPIRLVFLCNSPPVPAGVEKTALLLHEHIDRSRFDVRFILNGRGPFLDQLQDAGADVEVMPCGRRVCGRRVSLRWQKQLQKSLQERPADVVQLHLSRINAWWLKRHFPAIKIVERLNMTRHTHSWYPLQWPWLDRATARWLDHFVVVSESLKQQFVQRGYSEEKMSVVYNGISLPETPLTSTLREELGVRSDMPLMGTIGRLTPQKGMDTFLNAAARISEELPDARFVIAGEGELRDNLEEMTDDFGIRDKVFFLGYREDVLNVIAGLDVMLYLSRWEPFANTLLEAMGMGTPVVATEVGGNTEAIEGDVNGRLVPPESADAAANAAVDLIRDEELHDNLRQNARKTAERFSIQNMVQGHQDVYQWLAAQN